MDITKSAPPQPEEAEDEIARLARKIAHEWGKTPAARFGAPVIQRMPHGRTRAVTVEVKRSHRAPKPG